MFDHIFTYLFSLLVHSLREIRPTADARTADAETVYIYIYIYIYIVAILKTFNTPDRSDRLGGVPH